MLVYYHGHVFFTFRRDMCDLYLNSQLVSLLPLYGTVMLLFAS